MEQDVCIVGGGPAGLIAGLLFARAGVRTKVIHRHADFARALNGDTIHPATLELLGELGLLPGLLERPHAKRRHSVVSVYRRSYRVADFGHLPVRTRFAAMMPPWAFLEYIAEAARAYPAFELLMETEANSLIVEGARVTGVTTSRGDLRAKLVVAADGHGSALRDAAKLPRQDLRAPVDLLWFRVPKAVSEQNRTQTFLGNGEMLWAIDRGDHFHCARIVRKGMADRLRQFGLRRFRRDVARLAPPLAGWLDPIDDWDRIEVRSLSPDRLLRWWRPGLLVIGDAAHVTSPIAEIGSLLAIGDAVAAANILAGPLAAGRDIDALLARVQARRMRPTRILQAVQQRVHDRVIGQTLRDRAPRASLALRLLNAVPLLQRRPGRLLGLGVRHERLRAPEVENTMPSFPSQAGAQDLGC